jgi:metal-responsive CopG/Arc/MetJ family transcriptional regulator
MKTAISIPDEVFAFAEQFAKRQHLSRSELYTRAVSEYVEEHKTMQVREKLDSVYSTEPSKPDPALARLQSKAVKEKW